MTTKPKPAAKFAAAAIAVLAALCAFADKHGGKNPRTVRDEARAARKGWIVLHCGSDWSPAGAELAKMLKSSRFRTVLGSKYIAAVREFPDAETKDRAKKLAMERENIRAGVKGLSSQKMPALFIGSPKGDLFWTFENVPADLTPERLADAIAKADAVRADAEKNYLNPALVKSRTEAAELCGKFLETMEKQAGGIGRLKLECSYARAWQKLVDSDPGDATGWRRRFEMGDGIALVTKASAFMKDSDFNGGEAFIAAENAKPSAHLTVEQKQALKMMRFALYREDAYRKKELVELLEEIAAMGYDTRWGAAAVGWLNRMGEPPVAIPFGWRAKDMQYPEFQVKIHYGVKEAFREPGVYDITFSRTGGGGEFSISKIALSEDGRDLLVAEKPRVSGDGTETVFSIRFNPQYSDMVTHLTVYGKADREGADSSVSVKVRRRVLRPRGASKTRPGV